MRLYHDPRQGPVFVGLWLAAETVRAYMQQHGLTREKLAAQVGIAAGIVASLVDHQRASSRTIERISNAIGVSLPIPNRSDTFIAVNLAAVGDGFEYQIIGLGAPLKGWRRGRRTEVEQYARRIARAASDRHRRASVS